jgi:quinoprotein dehydrogenase-associated probable ABC transporter substrate-binding protein
MRERSVQIGGWEVYRTMRHLLVMVFKRSCAVVLGLVACCGSLAQAQNSDLVDRSQLRVCADPGNIPFSNDKSEGFENKIADLIAKELGVPVSYTFFPQATGFVRNTLNAGACDLVMGTAQGEELMQNTNHYYKSSYVLVAKPDSPLAKVDSLDDPVLKDAAIGIIAGTPPATIMAMNGLMGKARPYSLVVDRRFEAPAADMIADIASGAIDIGVLWGPMGGYYAKNSTPPLTVTPLVHETKGPKMSYRITMGMRRGEPEWKRQINELIAKKQNDINAILLSYGVPLLDESDQLITH